jgi:hypothetical protein
MVGRNKRVAALAALAVLVAMRSFHVELPHHHSAAAAPAQLAPPGSPPTPPVPPPNAPKSPQRNRREATPIVASARHALPFALYSASCAKAQGCVTATVVGQLEGACDARERTLERASLNDWARWRHDLIARHERAGCHVCVKSEWKTKVRRAVAQALNDEYASRSPTHGSGANDRMRMALFCAYSVKGGAETIVEATPQDLSTFLRKRSTVVFECPVPSDLRRAALDDLLSVRVSLRHDLHGAHPALPLVVQSTVEWPDGGPKIGACAWVKGGAYHDRDGNLLGLPAARVAEWLAHLRVLGVGHVLITDNSEGVFRQALAGTSARIVSPLRDAYAGLGAGVTVVPWPAWADDADQCSPALVEERITHQSNGSHTTQSLFGRPSQYAAQNACHRRLVSAGADWVTHNDVDEFLVPPPSLKADGYLATLLTPFGARKVPPRAVSMPCVFFAPCRVQNHAKAVGSDTNTMLLTEGTCAGKAQMHRSKLIAHASTTHLWVHYAFDGKPGFGPPVDLQPDAQLMLAHLRGGYSLDTALAARAVDNLNPTPIEERLFAERYNGRLMEGGLSCAQAKKNTEAFLGALTPDKRRARAAETVYARTQRNRRVTGLGISDCELLGKGELVFGWCWCVDDAPARLARRTHQELVAHWDVPSLRRDMGSNWPAGPGGLPNAPTRAGSGTAFDDARDGVLPLREVGAV